MAKKSEEKVVEKKVEKKPKIKFDMSLVDKMAKGNGTGDEYYDKYTRYRGALAVRVIDLPTQFFMDNCYSKRVLAQDVSQDVDVCKPPVLDIVGKKSDGHNVAVFANAKKIELIPVVVVADKESQIDWWLDRKGLK